MQRAPLLFLAFVSLLLSSCSKEIFFSNGDIKDETRRLEGSFKVIELCDNVNVYLKHRTDSMAPGHTHIQLRTGENLLPNITTEIHEDTLTIHNENILNWIRPYDITLDMTVYYDSIREIIFLSNGNLYTDTLRGYTMFDLDSLSHLYLNVEGGSGDIQLLTHCRRLHTTYNFGTATVALSGDARIAFTSASYNCHGPIDATKLETNIHYIYSHGTNVIKAKAYHEINANNHNNGYVYYLKYTGQYWSETSQSYLPVNCPEIVNVNGDNIYPLE